MNTHPVFKTLKIMTITVFIVGMIIIIGTLTNNHFKEYNSLKRVSEYLDTTYLHKQGGTRLFGPNGFNNPWIDYNMYSWDGGKNWYLVNRDSNQFRIIGLVDTIYPGLIEHLYSWEKLEKRVSKGPWDIKDTNDIKILKNAGFTVIVTKK